MDGSWELHVPFFSIFFLAYLTSPSLRFHQITRKDLPHDLKEHGCHPPPRCSKVAPCQLFAPHMALNWDVTSLSPATSFSIPQASGGCPPTGHHHVQYTAVAQTRFIMLCIPNSAVVCRMAHDRFVVTPLPPAFSFFPSPTLVYILLSVPPPPTQLGQLLHHFEQP
jgi:hypothetical protein